MEYPIAKRLPCSICGLDTFRHTGWFLVVENRWLDRLKILSWHSGLAAQKGMKRVCCPQHLKALVARWLTQASLREEPRKFPLFVDGLDSRLDSDPAGKWDSDSTRSDTDLEPESVGRLVGELAVHRESFSRVWTGSPEALEGILDALIAIGAENKSDTLEFQLFDPTNSSHGLSLQ